MKAITLRNVPSELARKIEKKASETHISMNKAVIELLEENLRVGHPRGKKTPIYHDLDRLAGTWSKSEAAGFQKGLDQLRRIDSELWR